MMLKTLPTMTDEEVSRCPAPDEGGFGSLTCEHGPLPLKAMDIQARIDGLVVQIALRQTFVNTHAQPIEATYIFPLPDRAAVTRFRLEVGDRVIEGQLKERGEARREYQQAVEKGHRAAITEEERPGVFTMRVGNLMPGETARVHLSLAGPLPYSEGEATFRFPLVVAPRYIPGVALTGPDVGAGAASDTDAVPDASRISPPVLLPGYPNPVRLSLRVDFGSTLLPHDLRSSLHTLDCTSDPIRRVELQPGERLNRDFILRFRLADHQIRTGLSLQPDADDSEGTFLLTLVPPLNGAGATRPRDVVFVLDRSGSMEGWKIVAARRAMARMVDTLTDCDRFSVIAFAGGHEMPPAFGGQLVSGSDRHRFQAVEFLTQIAANGGTEMAAPLEIAVRELNKDATPGRERILVLVTDGQVGNEDQILQHLGAKAKQIRIFTLGIDKAVNAAFLRRLSDLGGGASELVESEDRLDEVMDQVHRHIATPLLTGLKLEPAGLKLLPGSVVPGRLPDLFAGSPLLIMGRYKGRPQGGVALQGRDGSAQPWQATVRPTEESSPIAAAVWARARLREMEDRYVMKTGDPVSLEREIVGVSLRFGVLCRFTSFVAVDRTEVVTGGNQTQRLVQPVEQPAGWVDRDASLACCLPSPAPMAARVGGMAPPAAKNASLARRKMREVPDRVREQKKGLMAGDDVDLEIFLEAPGAKREESEEKQKVPLVPASLAPVPPAAIPTASPPAGQRWIQRLLGMIGMGPRDEQKSKQQVDNSVVRVQAEDLLKAMRGCPTLLAAHRLDLLRALKDRLEQLFRDLVAGGETVPAIHRLGVALESLEALLSPRTPSDAEIHADWDEIEAALQEYLGASSGQPARREGFWK
jgi:Ca-activated chloride channel homolog